MATLRHKRPFHNDHYEAFWNIHLRAGATAQRKQSSGNPTGDTEGEHQNAQSSPFVRIKSAALSMSLERLERVKGIEPPYSAWKSPDFHNV